ncbi:MAG TPA: glycosyltransferase family 2 protein [Casimicrobiaceae bacterium]|nr:glycosyltransferase family 2 protein [Casimicrobiaceae bacterium]
MSEACRRELDIAVLVPCFNEAQTVGKVIADFLQALPAARVYVYDNLSTDDTAARARAAGAIVRSERSPGKGNVIRRMFADIEADIYLIVDGDDTYDASAAPRLVERLLADNLDMVNGRRVQEGSHAFPFGHRFGNRALTGLVRELFHCEFRDVLSGCKVFSRRFVKSFPALARGFDIEIELTVHALEMRVPTAELPVGYQARPDGSESKLHTYRDGLRILRTMVRFLKEERPLQVFGLIGAILALVAVVLSIPLFITYFETGLVPRFPTAILVIGLMMTAALSITAGLILDTVTRGRQEMKRLFYLSIPALESDAAARLRDADLLARR